MALGYPPSPPEISHLASPAVLAHQEREPLVLCCATTEGIRLTKHAAVPIRRHVLVRGDASPYDGNLLYWARRLQQHHPLTRGSTLGRLLARQQGKCGYGGLYFLADALSEIDQRVPRSLGGDDRLSNRMALHRHCHDQRHAAWQVGGSPDNDPMS